MQVQRVDGHIPQLDGIRAIAILLVIATHFWRYPVGYDLLNSLAYAGRLGVDLFFVLSGFLITGILWRSRSGTGYYKNFYGRRSLRIFPAYFLLLIIILLIIPESEYINPIREDWWMYVTFLANVRVAMEGWQITLADVAWSLAVEEQFYLIWPFLVYRISTRGMVRLCAVLIFAAPIARIIGYQYMPVTSVYVLTPFRADSFAMGGLLAVIVAERLVSMELLSRIARWVFPLSVAIVLGYAMANVWNEPLVVTSLGTSAIGVMAASLLVLALVPGTTAAVLLAKPLVYLGKISYGLYLYHALCFVVFSKVREVGLGTTGSWLLDSTIDIAGAFALSVVSAALSFKFFETPFLKLKRYFQSEDAVQAGAKSSAQPVQLISR